MGESKNKKYFRVEFNKKFRVNFKGTQVTSDGGLLAIREMNEKLRLTKMADAYLKNSRHGKNIQHGMIGLLRQSVYSRLGGYEDTNDAEGLHILFYDILKGEVFLKAGNSYHSGSEKGFWNKKTEIDDKVS